VNKVKINSKIKSLKRSIKIKMNQILKKIFKNSQSGWQFWLAGGGFMLGILLLMLTVQIYLQISKLLNPQENSPDYLILGKKINIGNTLTFSKAGFSEADLAELKKQSFVKKLGTFKSNQFKAWTDGNEAIPLRTELFFESVPTEMMDFVPPKWDWTPEDEYVPVVLSQEFLNQYNFVYSAANNLPQLSKGLVLLAPALKTEVYGKRGRRQVMMKLVGFSDRIASILVPDSFMNWANETVGSGVVTPPARVIIQVDNPTNPDLAKYLNTKDLETNQDHLQASKAGSIIKIVMTAIGAIGVLFIGLAFVIFMMNFRVVLAEAKEEIRLLMQLGYTSAMLGKYLIRNFLIFMLIVGTLAGGILWLLLGQISTFFAKNGFEIANTIEPTTILVGIGFIVLSFFINTFAVMQTLKKYT
jgi:hypothetical protein